MKRGLKHDFSLIAIMLIPIGVGLNVVIAQLVQILRLPIWLDAIGTIVAAMVAGPWVGLVTGGATNLVKSIFTPTELPFALASMAIGFTVGMLSKKGMFSNFGKTVVGGLIVTVIAVIISTPIIVWVYGGISGSSASAMTAVLLASGQRLVQAVVTSMGLLELIDKTSSVIIAYLIVNKMSDRYLSKHNYAQSFIKSNKKSKAA